MLTTFKYDMHLSTKLFAPIYAVVFIIISVFTIPLRNFVFTELDVSVFIAGNRYIYISKILFMILAYIVPIYLYYISAFGSRSILYAMIPISSAEKISAKILCTIIWYSLSCFAYFCISILVCSLCDPKMFSFYLTHDAIRQSFFLYFADLAEIIFSVLLSIAILSAVLRLKFGRAALIILISAILLPSAAVGYRAYARYVCEIFRVKFPDLFSPLYTPCLAEFILFLPLSCIMFAILTNIESRRKLMK